MSRDSFRCGLPAAWKRLKALASQMGEYDGDGSVVHSANRHMTVKFDRDDDCAKEKRLVQIGEIKPALDEIGEPFRFIPED